MNFRSFFSSSGLQTYNEVVNIIFKTIFQLAAISSILIIIGIIGVLLLETIEFFTQVSIFEFFGSTRWTPNIGEPSYGVWPLIGGTLLIAALSSLIAVPIGIGAAIYLSEYAPDRIRNMLKPVLEILTGIPTIVFGYFALMVITPWIRYYLPETDIFNALSASIVVAIMILPMIISLCDDSMRAVPDEIRLAGFSMGATKWEVSSRIVVPAAFSGIMASFILAASRAIGETMAVTIAAGQTPNLTLNPLESIQTMTAFIVNVSKGDTEYGSTIFFSIFAVGMTLFVITLVMNIIVYYITHKYREVYE